jgi:hypothetical protein
MVADYFTKPLQGALFTKLRNAIMGITSMDSLVRYQIEERVGKRKRNDKKNILNNLNSDVNRENSSKQEKIMTYAEALTCEKKIVKQ